MTEEKKLTICPHDFVFEIPMFHELSPEHKKYAMSMCKCKCRMAWWTRIHIEGYHREDYPAYRCDDCKRVAVVNSTACEHSDYTIG